MSIVVWVVLGLAAGWLAGMAARARGRGVLGNVIVGALGAILGGWMGAALLGLDLANLSLASVALAALGAVTLILVLRALPDPQPFE